MQVSRLRIVAGLSCRSTLKWIRKPSSSATPIGPSFRVAEARFSEIGEICIEAAKAAQIRLLE